MALPTVDITSVDRFPVAQNSMLKRSGVVARIGNTPLIELKRISAEVSPVRILAKAEWFNPAGSVKDRPALNMVLAGERDGLLDKGKTILDATSGNTGIAYAMIGAALGYRVELAIPQNAGRFFKQILTAYGATLHLSSPQEGSDGAIVAARDRYAAEPEKYFYPDQYNNPANWLAHYEGTGVEIYRQTQQAITHFVAGLGTSGTFVGTSRRLKDYDAEIKCISFQPDSPFHGLEGLKHMQTSIVPGIYQPDLADDNIEISTEDAQEMVRRLAREEGVLVGVSSGAAVIAALRVARELTSGQVVTILPDNAFKYFDQRFWDSDGNGTHHQ
jgi:cysteine synthase B